MDAFARKRGVFTHIPFSPHCGMAVNYLALVAGKRSTSRISSLVPTVSPAQRRLMEAAAHTPGGYGGVPQSVGKEFVEKDGEPATDLELGGIPISDAADDAAEDTDFSIAQAIRDRRLPSPQKFGEAWLFALRITGTGAAWRESLGEWAFRDPESWLSEEFVQRCNGLTVVFIHPDGVGLDTEEYRQRAIGSIMLPYVEGDEVWGIAKIFDADAAALMQTSYRSTSPGVVPPDSSQPIELESGHRVLAEGLPKILDHLAVCQAGVWDKNGQPSGVRLDSILQKGEVVADKSEREQELEKELEAVRKERDDAKKRLDAAESEREEKERAEKERADARRKDETDEESLKAGEEGKADAKRDAKRDDARKRHHDAKKHDGAMKDCARCDAELEEIEKMDAAPEHVVEAGHGTEEVAHALKDSVAAMKAEIAELKKGQRQLTMSERDELARAYHRYDGLFRSLMDEAPQPIPGETPIAYRKRAANALRKYTQSFANYVFHDAQQVADFDLVEGAIIREATEHAKNPPAERMAGRLRAVEDRTTMPGKTITRWVGDQDLVWAPFTSPAKRYLKNVRTQPNRSAF